MQVREVMCDRVTAAPLGTSVQDAFEIMRDGGFRHLPVLDTRGNVAGILSDRDLRSVGAIYKDPATGTEEFIVTEDTTVDKIMIADPFTVSPDDPVTKAIELIREKRIGCLIVTESDRLVGILSYLDLLGLLLKLVEKSPAESAA
ncbi:MAG: CBS domain-containing protein [Gammaproteobacteria bacterium]|nr:CBS domain-containing protein [Gammaproteobacteria bacterium]